MSTSGVNNFIVTRDTIIKGAFRLLGTFGQGVTIPAEDMTNASEALNIMCKAMVMDGLPLWTVEEITVPMVTGQKSYSIGPASSQDRPLRILDAFIRSSTDNDVSLEVVSRYDYDPLGQKSSQSVPNQLFYDPQLTNGIVTVYGVPPTNEFTLHLVIQRQFQDFVAGTDNPDFPQEAYQLLKWNLADEIALEYLNKSESARITVLAQKAAVYREKFMAFQQEQTPIQFIPGRMGREESYP